MKVVIFAGGEGSRLKPELESPPKPLAIIGDRPIIWHVMKLFAAQGFSDFVVLLGHRAEEFQGLQQYVEPGWKLTLLNTGTQAMTGARLFSARHLLADETFFLTYADGLADLNLAELLSHHRASEKIVTSTGINPQLPFGLISLSSDGHVSEFKEKPRLRDTWINGGFFACEPGVFDYLSADQQLAFEKSPLEKLASGHQLACYKHEGYWDCMDHPHDLHRLNELWNSGKAPWKKWA